MNNLLQSLYSESDIELLKELSKNIKQRRINSNFTQREFAAAIGISKDQLSKIERTVNRFGDYAGKYNLPIDKKAVIECQLSKN
jgi:DNA-binding XRE family transcriptional regulator